MYENNGGLFVRLSEVAGWKVSGVGEIQHQCGHTVDLEGPDTLVANVIVTILNDNHECAET